MSGKIKAKKIDGVALVDPTGQTVLLWKATMPLSNEEHEQLSSRLRYEHENSGVNIILVPYLVVIETTEQDPDEAGDKDDSNTSGGEENDR
ncbi:hypothetical protein D3C73_852190 [compost metagenome]